MPSQIQDSHTTVKFNWKLTEYSKLGCDHESGHFALGNLRWKVHIYPRGDSKALNSLSLFLVPVDKKKLPYAEFSFVVQSHTDSKNNVKRSEKHQFTSGRGNGWHEFMPLTQLLDRSKGYLQQDTVTIQVEVTCRTREARA
ncbi:hypothetical protein C5167_030002 [Papaver somniferum]|uniref:ubiquitin carboxyl-terminal hydrolase 12-like n=1 Tax=Papaver somniferum TaxID=3469 RepID=UPI000E7058AF|nr:ubiquitin carboxyl-terminal hydrolase 12-like [Papaver somniferum]RZC86652.1 hypothetical protein C5167_030002 [Papaver somniferum]